MTEHALSTSEERDRRYTIYLIVIAVLGWSLASYDSNILTLTMPDIATEFRLSSGILGVLGFIVYAAEFVLALFVGWGMDRRGRKWMWMFCLLLVALFTGLTFFVQNFWQLAVVRALASGFAQAELAVSITLVNEQVPSRRRGLLYSIVQGGWPIGSLPCVQATNGTWSGAGYAYQAESFPTRVRAPAVGWMGAMFVGGLMLGSLLWTVLNEVSTLTVTWLVIGVGIGAAEGIATFFLPNIRPGQELEQIAT